ncbi:FAD-dependent oxidoreductase [Synechococcus sp. MIT S9504]|uniref:FAD-dependent oxidoreductase n=1 Tax=Synechococcus sp. MIT S9504 TaxID=1801628 RepID=UPI0007BC6557|nr:FAD-dependent oxidoreductase [Synechococcus sp. MIT S9504]KZR85580.1 Pentachlorophenol 4-monooxygenase [Synechococcus sp. MIT S9504]
MDHNVIEHRTTNCCVVGGGPAGLMLGLLLARQGIKVTVLESQIDFDRDFRGDTIHPAILEALDQIGLAERVLEIPHGRMEMAQLCSEGLLTNLADFRRLKTRFPFVAVLPQVEFLNCIAGEASRYSGFELVMGARVEELIQESGSSHGVLYRDRQHELHEVRAILTVGADGRFSKVRSLCGAELQSTSPPMDVLWFRVPRRPDDPHDQLRFHVGGGHLVVLLERDREWQVGYVLLKGQFGATKAAGLDAFRRDLSRHVSWLADRVHVLKSWKQIVVLSVQSSFVKRWHQPGLLLIGDAAHVMSPIGGVGINVAIQDAISAANLLTEALRQESIGLDQLETVQLQREGAVHSIQDFQTMVQNHIIKNALNNAQPFRLPLLLRILLKLPVLRNLPARIIAFGIRPSRISEHLILDYCNSRSFSVQ